MNLNSLISDIHQCCCIPATSDEIIDTINQVEEVLRPEPDLEPEYAEPGEKYPSGVALEFPFQGVSSSGIDCIQFNIDNIQYDDEGNVTGMIVKSLDASVPKFYYFELVYDDTIFDIAPWTADVEEMLNMKYLVNPPKSGDFNTFTSTYKCNYEPDDKEYIPVNIQFKIPENTQPIGRLFDFTCKFYFYNDTGEARQTWVTWHFMQAGTDYDAGYINPTETPTIVLNVNKNKNGEFELRLPKEKSRFTIVKDVVPMYINGELKFDFEDNSWLTINGLMYGNQYVSDYNTSYVNVTENNTGSSRESVFDMTYTYDEGKTITERMRIIQEG